LETAPDEGVLPHVSPELLLVLVRMLCVSSPSVHGDVASLLLSDPSAESESPCVAAPATE
jgi:hypothetical protein